ncbi:hypothetical protein B4123_4635 [Bacillus paralicheniformis]|uniref:Uncharacterized protein n=1 Tax=Bacillus paralicheniformis TaxID=1648923 RepID=A0A7Z0WVZ2_9BACI|nr:hypothetical protein SC10_B2orf03992 [Bacillus paralicheniformis]OLF90353.1 hypothetical protein B4121_3628 [Bacillus paralicheniformis]OLG00007.1 hypothetical protein B4123_4635 [Bacillus paralicheniformis]OLG08046.1 hypothetical protein B4125_2227 [Bacillus paralicheniformis]TWJ51975.1 hypothetical protein CHCC5023_4096 [Bacillus paralicheniformis]
MSFSFIGQSNETGGNPCGFFYSCGSPGLKKSRRFSAKRAACFHDLY